MTRSGYFKDNPIGHTEGLNFIADACHHLWTMKGEDLLAIGDLFDSLGWRTDYDSDSQFPRLFERFCRMCARLDKSHRDLILELTTRYSWIPHTENPKLFLAAWRKMLPQLPESVETVVVVPLLKPTSTRPKSSDMIYETACGYQSNLADSVAPRRLELYKSATNFARRYASSPNVALVFVDDYVGSGDTAKKAFADLDRKFPDIKPVTTILLALAVQEKAVEQLSDRCLVVAERVLTRGISDNAALSSTEDALRIMDEIGRRLGLKEEERLGYGATEALATLTRTPNNTFPVYWTNKKVRGKVWDSPFTRYTDSRRRRGS